MGYWEAWVLAGVLGVDLLAAFKIGRAVGSFLNFRSLMLVNFGVTQILSGVVHLASANSRDRGYFDLTSHSHLPLLPTALLINVVANFALLLGLGRSITVRKIDQAERAVDEVRVMPLVGMAAVCIPVGLVGLMQIRGYVSSLEAERVVAVAPGLAKYVYASHWLVWGINGLALAAIVVARRRRQILLPVVTLLAACLLVTQAVSWAGGRSMTMIFALPLVIAVLPTLGRVRLLLIPVLAFGAIAYAYTVTASRAAGASYDMTSMTSVIDWQWGRFSMSGFAADVVQNSGYQLGQTLASGVYGFIRGYTDLLHIPIPDSTWLTGNELAGLYLRGDSGQSFIVMGLVSELYVNLGIIGVAGGCWLLGILVAKVDNATLACESIASRLWLAYLGCLLVFRTINSDFGAPLTWAFYSGLPIFLLWIYDRKRGGQVPPGSQPSDGCLKQLPTQPSGSER